MNIKLLNWSTLVGQHVKGCVSVMFYRLFLHIYDYTNLFFLCRFGFVRCNQYMLAISSQIYYILL